MPALTFESAKAMEEQHVMKLYNRFPALFVRGAGCSLWDSEGNEYLDFLAGIAVCQLGHCHPAVADAMSKQARTLAHISNFLLAESPVKLAEKLCKLSGMDKAFFTVCGATANETCLKVARKHGNSRRPNGDYEIVALNGSFHGRTMGALSATKNPKYQDPFAPMLPGFRFVERNDIDALQNAVSDKTAAIYFEPILGESGILPVTSEFIREARRLCDENGAFLILDEVQTGMGRTGSWFNFQQHGIMPDLMALAKGLGSGFPIGACLSRGKASETLVPGDHGTTFGGSPLACAVGLAVIDTIENEGLIERAKEMGGYLRESLLALGSPIAEVRGAGLMLAARLEKPNARDVVQECFSRKLILNAPAEDALRFVPPLIVSKEEIDRAIAVLGDVLGSAKRAPAVSVRKAERLHDVLSIDDLSKEVAEDLLSLANYLKERRNLAPAAIAPVENRSVALVFEKPSLRTRVSFEAAIRELGGQPIFLSRADIGMGQREAVRDVASNLGRWCAAVVARLFWHRDIEEFAEHCEAPVINALTEMEHPCQALADMMTVREAFGTDKVRITYVGDSNNVARSLAKLATKLGYPFALAGPKNFWLEATEGVTQTESLEEGLEGARAVYTDVWISMGDEHEQEHRLKVFEGYQVNAKVMDMADPDAIFLHCLPAMRGYEVTDEVMDGKQSRVVDQAENRLHVQKALLQRVLGL